MLRLVCFSTTADLVAGSALVPVAAVSLGNARRLREFPFAALPAVFAVHQLIESLVWAGQDGDVSTGVAHAAAVAYVVIALPLLPALFPLAVLLVQPARGARRALPFLLLGLLVSARLGYAVAAHTVAVTAHPHALGYDVGVRDGVLWTVLYVIAVVGAALVSGSRAIVAFGVVNLVGLTAVALAYAEAFASLWCVYAALSSVLVAVHMVQRRRASLGQRSADPADMAAGFPHRFGQRGRGPRRRPESTQVGGN
jgi:hypothetical protein